MTIYSFRSGITFPHDERMEIKCTDHEWRQTGYGITATSFAYESYKCEACANFGWRWLSGPPQERSEHLRALSHFASMAQRP